MNHKKHASRSFSYEELLRFYELAGVDGALCEAPVNHFEVKAQPIDAKRLSAERHNSQNNEKPLPLAGRARQPDTPAKAVPANVRQQQPVVHVPSDGQVENAREAARTATTLEELRERLMAFDGCPLKFTAKNTCFADGTPGSDLMLIGEAPGRDEDIQGLPFVGRSGQLLNRILNAIGLERQQVYIANTIPWRPPGNRTPTPLETELCRPFIDRQIELANPKVLIALGGPAAKSLTGSKEGILRLRGNWKVHETASGKQIPVMPTLHPAYLLRTPAHKKFAWNDFLAVKMRLEGRD